MTLQVRGKEFSEGHLGMTVKLSGRLIALPSAHTALGEALSERLLKRRCRLALGAPATLFPQIDRKIDGHAGIYGQPVDLDRAESANMYFQIAFAQLGSPGVVVLEACPSDAAKTTTQRLVEPATRRLLHCLDAALPFIDEELHFVLVAPGFGAIAIPIATAFLAAKCAAKGKVSSPRVRMSVVSPRSAAETDPVSLAKTIIHMIEAPHYPDISETVLVSKAKPRIGAGQSSLAGAHK